MKLSAAFLPSSCLGTTFQNLLTSEEKQKLKQKISERFQFRCALCAAPSHVNLLGLYQVWDFILHPAPTQRLTDILGLCPKCSAVKHWAQHRANGREEALLIHLQTVNSLDRTSALQHVTEIEAEAQERGRRYWKLDLTLLEQYDLFLSPDRIEAEEQRRQRENRLET